MANENSSFISLAALERELKRALKRLLSRLEKELSDFITPDPQGWQVFLEHLQTYFPSLFNLYFDLYGTRYDFFFHLEDLLISLARSWLARPMICAHWTKPARRTRSGFNRTRCWAASAMWISSQKILKV